MNEERMFYCKEHVFYSLHCNSSNVSYCHVFMAPWLIMRGFLIGWLDLLTPSFTTSLNHNQLQQLTINDCLKLAPFLTGLRVSSTGSDLVLIYESHNYKRRTTTESVLSLMLRPTVSRPVCLGMKHPCGAYDQIFITVTQLRICWCGALSLTRGRVCNLQLLLALASAVILGSVSGGTRDHILVSQIRDFPFRRLLRLAGLR
jgi:hypothetical protein